MSRPHALIRLVPLVGTIAVAACAALMLAGWAIQGSAPVRVDTSLGLLICGVASALLVLGRLRPAFWIGTLGLVMGAATLAQYVGAVGLGIDEGLVSHAPRFGGEFPGRMAPNAALCLTLLGGALMLGAHPITGRVRAATLGVIGACVSVLAVFSLVATGLDLDANFGPSGMARMSSPVSLACVVLGFALACIAWEKTLSESAQRGWIVAVTAVAGLVATIVVVTSLASHDARIRDERVRRDLTRMERLVPLILENQLQSLERMAGRWKRSGGETRERWLADGRAHLDDSSTFEGIQLADRKGRVRWFASVPGTPKKFGLDALPAERREALLAQARSTGQTALGQVPAAQAQDSPRLISATPLGDGQTLVGVLRAERLVDFRLFDVGRGTAISMATADGEFVRYPPRSEGEQEAPLERAEDLQSATVSLRGVPWTLTAWPSDELDAWAARGGFPLLSGILLTLLATVALLLRHTALERARALEKLSEELEVKAASLAAQIAGNENSREQLREANARLSRSNEELERFAYIASHDLQEPLRQVASFCERLETKYGETLDDRGRTYIRFAVEGTARMRSLVQDILEYSRIDGHAANLESVDCRAALDRALESLSAPIAENDAQITCETLPHVLGNARLIEQVLQNLVGNAIKYRGPDTPRIHLGVRERPGAWELSVRDNGMGIAPQYHSKVFGVFERLHSSSEIGGTGIGLAVAQRAVERLGGRMWLESTPGEGSTFFFTLPTAEEACGAADADAAPDHDKREPAITAADRCSANDSEQRASNG